MTTQVRVTDIIANTYYARVHVARSGDPPTEEVDVDARPSDAINLAVRFGAPVYISKKIAGEVWCAVVCLVCVCRWWSDCVLSGWVELTHT
jgi:bifunctional DNase/RNase